MTARILVTDDDPVSRELFGEVLSGEGYAVDYADSGEQALERLSVGRYDVLLIDVRMPGLSGLDVTEMVRKDRPSLAIIVMTAFGSIETAIEAIRNGAFDYISKPMNVEELRRTVARALGAAEAKEKSRRTQSEARQDPEGLGAMIGRSRSMLEVYKTVARAAPSKSTALILGESGTGKELIARALHEHSPRASGPFVAVDCGALTETLLESELFGHVRGAFTGAIRDQKGVFEEAQGGTCFLDEVGDISLSMQAKLLRVLQEHETRRVGGQRWIKVDARVVAATNKDLAELVRTRAFRKDLYYRLKVVTIDLPPIRERPEDIPPLAKHFLRRYAGENAKPITAISEEAMRLLRTYAWPGNIRELEHAIERAVVLSAQSILMPEDLPPEVQQQVASLPTDAPETVPIFAGTPTLEEVKKRYVVHVLQQTSGNIAEAAKILDIDRRSLYRMLERYRIPRPART